MKHALRKYLSPCGSALFMVVSTVAALTVLVTAMYMSVLSSRQVQYATFDQEQAYVTSASVGDMVYSYVADNMAKSPAFITSMQGLKQGESLSTKGNGFAAFGGTNEDDERLGAVDASITYIYDIGQQSVYDLAITVENNGVYETTHTFIKIDPGEPGKMRRINNFFTSTGYLPTDIWINKVLTDSTVYFDNEFVNLSKNSKGSSSDAPYDYNIVALGSVNMQVGYSRKADHPLVWTIGSDFKLSADNVQLDLSGQSDTSPDANVTNTKHGVLIVGRDMYLYGNDRAVADNTDIYVLGNLYLNCTKLRLPNSGRIFVKGKVYKNNTILESITNNNLFANGGVCDRSGSRLSEYDNICGAWGTEDIQVTADYLSKTLTPSTWPSWEVKPSVDNIISMHFYSTNNNTVYIDRDGTLDDWVNASTSNANKHVIVIDTGDDIGNVRTLKLTSNIKGTNMFSWNPFNDDAMVVLTVGKGSLVLNLGSEEAGDQVVYQDSLKTFFGNIAWFTACGGRVNDDGTIDTSTLNAGTGASNNFAGTIRSKGFIITESDITTKCSYVKETTSVTINGKTETRGHYTCTTHGGWYDFDDTDKQTCQEIDDYVNDTTGTKKSLCIGRINQSGFDDFYKTSDGQKALASLKSFYNNYGEYRSKDYNNFIYPNVNIFIASISQNAEINLGKTTKYDNYDSCIFFGYIYAPYMTFYIDGNGGSNDSARQVGGLVVSDIVLSMDTNFVFCQPDVSIPGMAGNNWSSLGSMADKSWRLSYGLT